MDYVTEERTARKDYQCNACLFIRDNRHDAGINWGEGDESTIIRLLDDRGGKILKGERYYDTRLFDEGRVFQVRSGIEAHNFCTKHELYPDD